MINNIKIDSQIAFTGKLDLYGNLLKVRSIKEKIITAYNNNINTIYLPKSNYEDIYDVPDFILKEIFIYYKKFKRC